MSRTSADIDGARGAHVRLADTLSRLTDAQACSPSLLPGWTVGHVLTHLARNADSHVRMFEAAGRGQVADQYPGGQSQRASEIEAGAGRRAADLAEDVRETSRRLEAAWDAASDDTWKTAIGRLMQGPLPVSDLPFGRWREVEVHHADLGLGYSWADWPDSFADAELARAIAGLPERLPDGVGLTLVATDAGQRWVVGQDAPSPSVVTADRRRLLAWLLGRIDDPAFPVIRPWQLEHRRS
jgi:maleylpyruvate isomerase